MFSVKKDLRLIEIFIAAGFTHRNNVLTGRCRRAKCKKNNKRLFWKAEITQFILSLP